MPSKTKRTPKTSETRETTPRISSRWCFVLLGFVILFFSVIRIRLRDVPLERDEGEYAYAGQLMLQGIPPYRLAYNMKLPGTYAAYALILAVFGQSPAGIHLGLLLVNAATVILLFFLVKRLFGEIAGLVAASSYALLSTSASVLGFAAHATHFVVLAALSGILVLLTAMEQRSLWLYFASGILLGLAFVLKQPGLVFVAFGSFFLVVDEWRRQEDWRRMTVHLAVYSTGAIIPFAMICVILYFAGVLGKMWFWTFAYGTQYASRLSFSQGWPQFVGMSLHVAEPAVGIWILAALGLAALAWDSRTWRHAVFVFGFLLFSWAGVCPGLYFRQHYFILVLPAVCLLVGIAVSSATHELFQHFRSTSVAAIPLLAFVAVMAVSVSGQSKVFFELDPLEVCRNIYGSNPFPEAQTISQYLKNETSEDARIAVIGSEPEIYFYSKRHSATGYIYVYPLVEPQEYALAMQKDMVREIENNRPDYLVYVEEPASWLASPGASTFLLDWFHKYAAERYEVAGIVDEIPQSQYLWGEAAKSYKVQSEASIVVFKRRNNIASGQ
jgi:hypothetical protein